MSIMDNELSEKFSILKKHLLGLGRVVVAYSGGVDSSFLGKVAVDTLGAENVFGCIAKGPSLPESQYNSAIEIAAVINLDLSTIETNELGDPDYIANRPDRCYVCKLHILKKIKEFAGEKGVEHILSGHNLDDEKEYRPGHKAEKMFDIITPLADAQLTKEDIRTLSHELNLPTADMPSTPCLATRIAFGIEITSQRLKQVEQAEEFLKMLGLKEFRVRHHDEIARIEVKKDLISKIAAPPVRARIDRRLKELGFKYVTVDLAGFHSGSMNPANVQDMIRQED